MTVEKSHIIDMTEQSFLGMATRDNKLIVVEFWSPTCQTCREVAPIYEAVSQELSDEAIFCRMNTEDAGGLSRRLGVAATPTFMFFCHEKNIGGMVGMTNQTALRNTIRDAIRHKDECASHSKKIVYEPDGYG
jgi:thioredoxin 1